MKGFFNGGIHPQDQKELTAGGSLRRLPPPAEVVIPLLQHIGSPCQSMVRPGEAVLLGQKIGDGPGLCVPVHASVSGQVTAVEPRPHPGGRDVLSVVIKNDFQDRQARSLTPQEDAARLSAQEILAIIREAGIVGMGGAAFPTQEKAQTSLGKVDTLIANGCECEPYLTADDLLLRTDPQQVLEGMNLMRRALGSKRAVLAVEDNKKSAIAALQKHMSGNDSLELKILPTRYPQGAEKQLVQALTGRQVPPGGLPYHVGCAVFNVATLAAVYQAVVLGQPLTRRIVTVTGKGVASPANYMVPIGTPISSLIAASGGLTQDIWKVINGGPMMGLAQGDLDVPVIKGTNGVLCLTLESKDQREKPVCIRCGKCVTVCPVNLQPLYFYRYERTGDLGALERLNLMDCIECGCCTYICPGKLPLVERIRAAKRVMREGISK